jgi:hypothetical protein
VALGVVGVVGVVDVDVEDDPPPPHAASISRHAVGTAVVTL